MRNTLFTTLVAILVSFFFSSAAMAQEKVFKLPNGYFVAVERGRVVLSGDTGVVIQRGIELMPPELQKVMGGGTLVTKSNTTEVWGRYYLYRIQITQVTEVVQREGDVIKRVEVNKKEAVEKFNPLLPLALFYAIMMVCTTILTRISLFCGVCALLALLAVFLILWGFSLDWGARLVDFIVSSFAAFATLLVITTPKSQGNIFVVVMGTMAMVFLIAIIGLAS